MIHQQVNFKEINSGLKQPNIYHVFVRDSNEHINYLFKGSEKAGFTQDYQCFCCFFF